MRRFFTWRWSRRQTLQRGLVAALAVLAYLLLLIPGYRSFGATYFALSLVPVGLAGYLLGSLSSVVVGLALLLASQPLLPLIGLSGLWLISDQWAGLAVMFLTGLGLGWLSDLLQQLRDQAAALRRERLTLQAQIGERQRAEAEISHLNAELENRVADRSADLLRANAELQTEIAERQRAEAEITQQARTLARSRDFLAALGQVAAHIASELELDQILTTLSAELRRLDLYFFLTETEPDRPAVLRYVSVDAPVLAMAERQFGFALRGWSFPSQPLIDREVMEGQRPLFFPSMPALIEPLSNPFLRGLIEQAFRLAGITPATPACLLPLVVHGQVWGMFGIWGVTLQEADQPALSVLAHQLAVAIENARLFAAEHDRAAELARAGEQLRWELAERRRAEEALPASERRFRALIEHSADVVLLLDAAGFVLYHSPAVQRVLGYTPEELQGRNVFAFIHPDDTAAQRARLAQLLSGSGPISRQLRLAHHDGTWRWIDATATNLLADPDVQAIVINYRDVSEHRLNAELEDRVQERTTELTRVNAELTVEIRERQQAQLRGAAFSALGQQLSATTTPETAAEVIVATADQLLGWDLCFLDLYRAERDLIQTALAIDSVDGRRVRVPLGDTLRSPPAIFRKVFAEGGQLLLSDSPETAWPEMETFGDSALYPASLLFVPIRNGTQTIGCLSIQSFARHAYDPADLETLQALADHCGGALERIQTEERIRASLRDKEVLLKEIHHRVKNNLQVINSLLSLQSRQVSDPRALEMLRDSQNRVRSMALVHEKLYRSADLAHVDFAEYIRGLASQLLRTYADQAASVVLTVQAEACPLDVELAVSCGLILNELVSNALKHAFPGGRSGEIRITLERAADGQVFLRVSDDGLGWPPGLDFQNSPSLGLQLVNNLVAQIGATLALEPGPGTTFRIAFSTAPLATKSDRA